MRTCVRLAARGRHRLASCQLREELIHLRDSAGWAFCGPYAERCSRLGAAWLASRIVLVNPMVFTRLPSSLLLIAVRQIGRSCCPSPGKASGGNKGADAPILCGFVAPSERSFASSDQCRTQRLLGNRLGYRSGLLMLIVAFSAPLCVGEGQKSPVICSFTAHFAA